MQEILEKTITTPEGLNIRGEMKQGYEKILTPEALDFLVAMQTRFNDRRKELLAKRETRQEDLDAGKMPDFLPETKHIRESDWQVAPIPEDLQDRRVEITGPVDRKMVINALNSGAKIFMADFEDANSPTFANVIEGQQNLIDANLRTIEFTNEAGKEYKLKDEVAVLLVRPRGLHLEEKHIQYKGENLSGSLMDFGLYLFHNHEQLKSISSGPYYYLPKLESHLEARLWNDVFVFAQEYLGIPKGTIKATVLIETILSSFELNEIIYELREHMAGLNCGRWDYIFSYIKRFRNLPGYILPDRAQVTMTVPFMKAYTSLVIQTCHKRGCFAMGGMAAQIPIRNNRDANDIAVQKVRDDKLREVKDGHDGTWVAHPGLVPIAMAVFDEHMQTPNNLHVMREEVQVSPEDLVACPKGTVTAKGLRTNINVGILYIESWLRGNGAAALYNLMEDAATAEISRTQVWQWIKNGISLIDGRKVTYELYQEILPEELDKIKEYVGEENYKNGRFEEAVEIFSNLVKADGFTEFLTLAAYEKLD